MAKRNAVPKKERTDQFKLGLLVRSYRQQLGITQEELAWRANLHRTYIANVERGGRNITLRSILSLASALQIPVEWLFAEEAAGRVREVLLVEDDPADVDLILRAFRKACVHNPISVARDGQEAIDRLLGGDEFPKQKRMGSPQLILLDLNLPKLSGLEVLKKIKADERTRAIPVIVLSASRHDRDVIECGRLGAQNYIIKPFTFESLCSVTPALRLSWSLTGGEFARGEPTRREVRKTTVS